MWTTILYLVVPVLGGGFVGGLISSSSKSLCGLYTGLIAYVICYLLSPIQSYGNQFQVLITAILFILFGGLLGFLGALLAYKWTLLSL